MILFVDEADRVIHRTHPNSVALLPFLLKILNPESKTFYHPFLKTKIDISRLMIILAGNDPNQDDPLSKQLFSLYVEGYSPEVKQQIIWDHWVLLLLKNYSQNQKYTLSVKDIAPEDVERINTLILAGRDPGFRTLEKVLSEYVTDIAQRKHFHCDVQPPSHLLAIIKKSNKKLAQYKKLRKLDEGCPTSLD